MELFNLGFNEFVALYLIVFFIYLIILFGIIFIYRKLKNHNSQFLDLTQYLPEVEIYTLRQISYLIFSGLIFIDIAYIALFSASDVTILALFDVILSLIGAIFIYERKIKNILIMVCLIPVSSTLFLAVGNLELVITEILHIIALFYVVWVSIHHFIDYSKRNELGFFVLLLFALIAISLIVTTLSEPVNIFDALVMVTNAFTSNGYSVLGTSQIGKLNSIFLTWGGYILSGVGTATLTAAILTAHFNRRFDELEMLIKEKNDD